MPLPMLTWNSMDSSKTAELGNSIKSALTSDRSTASVKQLLGGNAQSRTQIEYDLSSQTIETMERFGLIRIDGGSLVPFFQAKLIGPHLVFSDLRYSMKVMRATQDRDVYVDPMWEGPIMANLMIRGAAESGLDMGCGCGVIALAMSTYCKQVVATDMNPRALMLAKFNMALNDVHNVEVVPSDLFAAIQDVTFDRIVFNAPVGMELLPRNALESGEQILVRFFAELSSHLRNHGIAQLNLCVKDWTKAPFHQNLRHWLNASADEYQSFFLELWRVDRGVKFEIRKLLSPFVFGAGRGKLLAIKRGQIFLRRNHRPRHYEFATPYGKWAQELGEEFGEAFIIWAMDQEIGDGRDDHVTLPDFVANLTDTRQATAETVVNAFQDSAIEIDLTAGKRKAPLVSQLPAFSDTGG